MTPETLAKLVDIRAAVSAVTGVEESDIAHGGPHSTAAADSARLLFYLVAADSSKIAAADIADLMDMTPRNVYMRLSSARDMLETDRGFVSRFNLVVAASQSERVCPCCKGTGVVQHGGS